MDTRSKKARVGDSERGRNTLPFTLSAPHPGHHIFRRRFHSVVNFYDVWLLQIVNEARPFFVRSALPLPEAPVDSQELFDDSKIRDF